jgi:hypothetical protein
MARAESSRSEPFCHDDNLAGGRFPAKRVNLVGLPPAVFNLRSCPQVQHAEAAGSRYSRAGKGDWLKHEVGHDDFSRYARKVCRSRRSQSRPRSLDIYTGLDRPAFVITPTLSSSMQVRSLAKNPTPVGKPSWPLRGLRHIPDAGQYRAG